MKEELKLLRIEAVIALCGLKRSTIYKCIQENNFPKQIKIGPRAVAWRADEIQKWIRSREKAT